jgi:hypothetical protein
MAATNLRNGTQSSLFVDTGDSQTFLVFLKSILEEYPKQNIWEKEDAFGDLLFLKGICSTIVQ